MKFTIAALAAFAGLAVAAPVADAIEARATAIYCLLDTRDPLAGYKRCPPAPVEARATAIYCLLDTRDPFAGVKRCPPAAPEA